jgi:hypothetical protein
MLPARAVPVLRYSRSEKQSRQRNFGAHGFADAIVFSTFGPSVRVLTRHGLEAPCYNTAPAERIPRTIAMLTRRSMMKLLASALPAAYMSRMIHAADSSGAPMTRTIAPGPFEPTWESLKQYAAPDWFRDAKFGIWNHWSAQCVPEQGDWYARQMYIQGHSQNKFHLAKYGHPTKFGFMEIDNLWKAENWDP